MTIKTSVHKKVIKSYCKITCNQADKQDTILDYIQKYDTST